jgi:hypothetical protein
MTATQNILSADFEFFLPFPLQIHFPTPEIGPQLWHNSHIVGEPPMFNVVINDAKVIIEFDRSYTPSHGFLGGYTISSVYALKLKISRVEKEPIPHDNRQNFLSLRADEYRKIAIEAMTRIFYFFKYKLRNPFIEMPNYGLFDKDATWSINGEPIGRMGAVAILDKLMGNAGQLDIEQLTVANQSDFEATLNSPLTITITQEYLSEAQTAIIRRDFKKAVIDLAIACEVGIKTAFFKSDFSYDVLNALEDSRKIEVSPLEMIQAIAKRVLGKGFKDFSAAAYEDIENLFRCRNKVAHRGELTFTAGNSGKKTADIQLLEKWWISTQVLLEWLRNTVTTPAS